MTTLTAVFDGEALRPEGTVNLVPNRRYRIHLELVETSLPPKGEPESAWDVLEQLDGSVEGPTDWAGEHDHYLYGTEKRGAAGQTPIRPAQV